MRTLQRSFLALCLFASVMDISTGSDSATLTVSRGVQLFSSNFFKNVTEVQYGDLICSPLSANIVLSMAANGAAGSTEQQFEEVLKLPASKQQTLEGYQNLIDKLNNVENVTLSLANKIFIDKGFPVKSEYKQDLQTYYRSDIQSVDFSKSEEAANTINTWSKNETNNRIDNIVTADDLKSNTALVLANAVYFKGTWAQQFNVNDTEDRSFWVGDDALKLVPTMYRKGNYKYVDLSDYDVKCIELPYANKDVSMVIILPNKLYGLSEVINKLDEVSAECSTRLAQTSEREVRLYLPKFKTETTLNLNGVLQEMGLVLPFTDNANFTGISNIPLQISKVVQKAFIEVNEEGSEAAAVTVQRSFLAFCLFASVMDISTGSDSSTLAVSQGLNLFSSKFVKYITSYDENAIISPLTANVALSMAADGAAGSTEQQFKEVLKLPASKPQTLEGYQNLIDKMHNVENVTLSLANKIFIGKGFSVKPEYKQDLQTYYRSDIQSVDFSKSEEAANIINTWSNNETDNRIDNIVTADDLDSDTALILANAVYFKSKWAQQFNVNDTKNQRFAIADDSNRNIPTMYRKGNYKYVDLSDYDAKCIELPYANKDISMVIILPNKRDTYDHRRQRNYTNYLSVLIEKLDEVSTECNTRLAQTSEREVHLYLPKFKFENSKLNFYWKLHDMGLVLPFTDSANFAGISDVPLKISKVVQKAFIQVDEEGSEAAAVTGISDVPLKISKVVQKAFIEVDEEGSEAAAVTEKNGAGADASAEIPVFFVNRTCYYTIVKVDRIQEYQSTTASFSTILFSGVIQDTYKKLPN